MTGTPTLVRPTAFRACPGCKEATRHFQLAQAALEGQDVTQLTAICEKIQGKTEEHPGTAEMQIRATLPMGEEGANHAVDLGDGKTNVVVFCEGAIKG